MKKTMIVGMLLMAAVVSAGFAPMSDYSVRQIEGWKVLVNKDLLMHSELAHDTLRLLRVQLYQITRVVPEDALEAIRKVPIWVEYNHPKHPCMCYHPSRKWLTANDFNPQKERGVEIANARNFLTWTKSQPWMVLHELAHGYHHNVLGYGHKAVNKAYKDAVAAKSYESVQHINGRNQRAYALNNDQEYFAECTEAFFGTNDFYPFVRSELKAHDPNMFEVLREVWGTDRIRATSRPSH